MIVVKLQGGLGNQMFQYASALSLANKKHTQLRMDLSWYKDISVDDTARYYELNCFNLPQNFINPTGYYLDEQNVSTGKHLKNSIKSLIGKKRLVYYIEPNLAFNNKFSDLPNETYLDGYFQSEKYFKDIRSNVIEAFAYRTNPSMKNSEIINKANNTNSVSLHVRRGDYISNKFANKFHGLQSLEYYKQAVKIMNSNIAKPYYFVISDDITWCKANLPIGKNTIFVSDNKTGSEDLRIMIECKHNIIANSSFSWWGAWLGKNNDKQVIAPKHWFVDKTIDSSDIIPSRWQKI